MNPRPSATPRTPALLLLAALLLLVATGWRGQSREATEAAGAPHGSAAGAVALIAAEPPGLVPSAVQDPRFFGQTGFRIADEAFWNYFSHRGGLRTFGYPVSRTFVLDGFRSQMFQRGVLQATPEGGVRLLNLLDPGLMPYTRINGSTYPASDPALLAALPSPDQPDYQVRIVEFVQAQAPDTWNGVPVNFAATYFSTVTCADAFPQDDCPENLLPLLNLELWGAPISAPTFDPANQDFVYQRFQRGIMHYDRGCNCTQGLLLADYFKSILTGQNLPDDLAAQAADSPFLRQYDPTAPGWVAQPGPLRDASDFTQAFEPQTPLDERFGMVVTGLGDQFTPSQVQALLSGVGSTWWYTYNAIPLSVPQARRVEMVRTGERWSEPDLVRLRQRAAASPGTAWMVGNEPNVPAQDNADPAVYAEQLHRWVEAIKSVDPRATIVAPNVLNWDATCTGCAGFTSGHAWTEAFLAAYLERFGEPPPIDVWSIHAYEIDWKTPPMLNAAQDQAEIEAFRRYLNRFEEQRLKPIWLTEFGTVWAFEGFRTETVDGQSTIVPIGAYRDDLVIEYVDAMAAWLTGRGTQIGVERWFIYASYGPPEPYASESGVLSLYNGPTADTGLTSVGAAYRAHVVIESP